MRKHLGRAPGIVLIALAAFLGACPAAWAQPDIDRVLKGAVDAWKEGSQASRARAIETLASLGNDAAPAVPLLASALRDSSPPLRRRAAEILGQMGSLAKDALPALTAMLEDPEVSVRKAAARAIGRQRSRAKGAIKALVASLQGEPDRRCPTAAFALASIGEPALPAVIDLLKSDDPALRRAAIEGVKESIEAGLWRQDSPVGQALASLYPSAARDVDPAVRIALARMLVVSRSESPPVRSALGVLLRDPDAAVRLAVAQSVEKYSQLPAELRDAFFELSKDADSRVRVVAARAIAGEGLGDPVVIERLLAALKDPEADVRAAAAQKLAGARSTQYGTDGQNRVLFIVWTSKALARHPAAGRALRSALDDSNPQVRAAAAHLLPVFPAEAAAAIPRLMETLRDPAPAVRAASAEALAELGPKARPAVRALLGIVANADNGGPQGRGVSFAAATALAAIGGDARAKMFRLLIGQLNSLDDDVRERAEQIVVQLGPRVGNDLFRILSDPKSPHRIRAEAQELLYTLLINGLLGRVLTASPPAPVVRAAMPVMRALARDADPEVQIAALALLSTVDPGTSEAAELYRDHVRSGKDLDLRDQWLTWVIKPAMIPALIKGLEDRDIPVRLATVNALSNLAEEFSHDEQAEAGDGRPDAAKAQARADRRRLAGQAARALLASLEDPDGRIRWIAAQTLGVLHAEAKVVVPALASMVNAEAGRVPPGEIAIRSFQAQGQGYVLGENKKGGDPLRVAAIQGLAGFGREAAGAMSELVRALEDKDVRVRWFAAEALGLIGPDAKAAVPALVEALRSRDAAAGAGDGGGEMVDGPIRLIAAFALGRIGPEARAAIPDLIAALSGPDSRVRVEAACALGLIGPDARAAVPELVRLTRPGSVSHVAEYALGALAHLGPAAVPALIEMLHDDDPRARARALRILGRMSANTAVPVLELVQCLRDRDADVRVAAAGALADVGDRPEILIAIPRLIATLRDPEDAVSDAARNALSAIGRPALPAVVEMLGFVAARVIEFGDPFETDVIPLDVPES